MIYNSFALDWLVVWILENLMTGCRMREDILICTEYMTRISLCTYDGTHAMLGVLRLPSGNRDPGNTYCLFRRLCS